MKDNTIVTIGDINYLWGIFMLMASARKAGMKEPFMVGVKGFTPEAEQVLTQLGGVSIVHLDDVERSLTCLKTRVMLQVKSEYVTWADSDAFFTGNVSELLPPDSPEKIQFRLRTSDEMPPAFRGHEFGEDGRRIPKAVLDAWHNDILAVAGEARDTSRYITTGSACFCSLSIGRHRRFLEIWNALQEKVLPDRNVGVVDKSLAFYHQLDESTLNACLNFVVDAPQVQPDFRLNRDRERLFVHFIARPKPWQGWTSRAFRFFDEYVSIVTWAQEQGLSLPGEVPPYLKPANKWWLKATIPWMELKPKLTSRLKRFFL